MEMQLEKIAIGQFRNLYCRGIAADVRCMALISSLELGVNFY